MERQQENSLNYLNLKPVVVAQAATVSTSGIAYGRLSILGRSRYKGVDIAVPLVFPHRNLDCVNNLALNSMLHA